MTKFTSVPCRPKFKLGQIVFSPSALKATTRDQRLQLLARHSTGDWGICFRDEDWKSNDKAINTGARIMSAYPIDPTKSCEFGENTVWIITEGDRSLTMFLLDD